jgi:hypothetical protein
MDPLKEELLKRLDVLAEKLGTTGVYLWAILMRQVRIEAIENLVFALFFSIGTVILYKTAKWMWNSGKKGDDIRIGSIFVHIACGISTFISLVLLVESVEAFFNPAYFALKMVMGI